MGIVKSRLRLISEAEGILLKAERERRELGAAELRRFNELVRLAEFRGRLSGAAFTASHRPRVRSPLTLRYRLEVRT
jgi:hypothetical protein